VSGDFSTASSFCGAYTLIFATALNTQPAYSAFSKITRKDLSYTVTFFCFISPLWEIKHAYTLCRPTIYSE